jgi:hypothetical protein
MWQRAQQKRCVNDAHVSTLSFLLSSGRDVTKHEHFWVPRVRSIEALCPQP